MGEYRPLVSIVIPVYNGSNYLAEAIDSAINQTYKNIEIIIVNDGSSDGGKTEAIAKSYGNKIRYINKQNGGSSSALNVGIKNMRGEWFSWLSHDDLYYPNKVEQQIKYINEKFDSLKDIYKNIFFAASDYIDSTGRCIRRNSSNEIEIIADKVNKIKDNKFFIAVPTKYNFHGCSCLIHKNAFEQVGLFDEKLKLVNDIDMWYRLLVNQYVLNYVPCVLVSGRVHKEQVSMSIGYSYHNTEQDMFWKRSLEWLKENCLTVDEYELILLFGRNAYLKTRFNEGDDAFSYVKSCGIRSDVNLFIQKWGLIGVASVLSLLKKVYLKIRV